MALLANRIVVGGRHRPVWDVVRVVARGAAQLASALDIALRLPQPIVAVRDFEAIRRSFLLATGPIELHAEIAQWLPWDVRDWRSVKPADGVRKILAGRLEVALHTYLEFPLGRQALRVYNGSPNLLPCHAGGSEGDVPLPRPMTSLAIDSFRNRIEKNHLRVGGVFERLGNFGIGIVAEDALVVHGAYRAGKIRLIVPRAHIPIAALFGIPAQGQHLKRAVAGEMKIGERMVSRADDVIDLFLIDIRLLAIEPDLPAPLVVAAVARHHG